MNTMFRFGNKKEESEFDKSWGEYKGTIDEIKTLQKSLRSHLQITREYVASSAALAIQLATFFADTEGGSRCRAFGQLHADLERIQMQSVDQLFATEIDIPTNVVLSQFPDTNAEVKLRKKMIADMQAKKKKYENKKQELADYKARAAKEQQMIQMQIENSETPSLNKQRSTNYAMLGRKKKTEPELVKELSDRKQRYDDAVTDLDKKTEYLEEKFLAMKTSRQKGEILSGPVSGLVAAQYHLSRESAKRLEKIRKLFESNDVYMRTLQRFDEDLVKGIAFVQDLVNAEGLEFGRVLKSSTPRVICDCMAYIKQGFEVEGLFRVPGNKSNVNILQEAYDKGETGVLNKITNVDIHDICSLMKHYLACMPEPLIPNEQFQKLLALIKTPGLEREVVITEAVAITQTIKGSRKGLLGLLLNFLHDVSKFKQVNQMSANNLATCFVPVICNTKAPVRSPSEQADVDGNKSFANLSAIVNLAPSIAFVTLLIENARKLPVPTEEAIAKNTNMTLDVRAKLQEQFGNNVFSHNDLSMLNRDTSNSVSKESKNGSPMPQTPEKDDSDDENVQDELDKWENEKENLEKTKMHGRKVKLARSTENFGENNVVENRQVSLPPGLSVQTDTKNDQDKDNNSEFRLSMEI